MLIKLPGLMCSTFSIESELLINRKYMFNAIYR